MMDHTVHNERTKLSANYLNGLAVTIFAVGGLGPWLTMLYGTVQPGGTINAVSIVCICISLALHFYARRILKRLRT